LCMCDLHVCACMSCVRVCALSVDSEGLGLSMGE